MEGRAPVAPLTSSPPVVGETLAATLANLYVIRQATCGHPLGVTPDPAEANRVVKTLPGSGWEIKRGPTILDIEQINAGVYCGRCATERSAP